MKHTTKNELVDTIDALAAQKGRVVVAIAGPPGAGKSTLAKELVGLLAHPSEVLPMDGFHLENDQLTELGLLDRKGAPETFDVAGFIALITRLRDHSEIKFPTFDRERDQTVPEGGCIRATTQVVLVEGNYLLLDTHPWRDLSTEFDLTVRIDVPLAELKERLMDRWRQLGLSEQSAEKTGIGKRSSQCETVS